MSDTIGALLARRARNRLALVAGATPYSGSLGASDGTGSDNSQSGANYGYGAGQDGLSPGRGALPGAVSSIASAAIPGAGLVSGIGNAFNGAVAGMQQQGAVNSVTGTTGGMFGAAVSGALGIGDAPGLGGYGKAGVGGAIGMSNAMDPGTSFGRAYSKSVADFYGGLAAANTPSAPPGRPGYSAQGGGPQGVNSDVSVNDDSAMAFGASISNMQMAQGTDGVNMGQGAPTSDFGMGIGAGDSGSQGGSGQSGAGGASSGGSGGGAGANGGGGDNAGGWAKGGPIQSNDFHRASGLARRTGLVDGPGDGNDDSVRAFVQSGGFVVPAKLVTMLGKGSNAAGGRQIAGMLPPMDDKHDGGSPVEVKLSDGEFYINPSHVAAIGKGDLDAGHTILEGLLNKIQGQKRS